MKLLLNVFLISCGFLFQASGQESTSLIKEIFAEIDVVQNGAKGFSLNYSLDFRALNEKYPTDSLLKNAMKSSFFKIAIQLSQNGRLLKPGYGFAELKDGNGNYLKISKQDVTFTELKNGEKSFSIFIPYASFKLSEGSQQISASIDVSLKDAKNEVFKDSKSRDAITFTKPNTHYFVLALDSLCVNSFDTKGQAWDHSFTGSDSPDLDFDISLGNQTVGNIHKGNSYCIVFSEKPRIFKFEISENDEVFIHLKDTDDVYDDDIASWKFDSTNMKEGIFYRQTERKANLQVFSFSCKLE